MYTSYSGMLYLLRNKMAARVKLILLFLLQVYSITGVTSLCPVPDFSFDGSCSSATQTITVDWSTYPTDICQEVEIVIPANYATDTCTWRVEHSGSTVTTGIAVNAVTGGAANSLDMITVAFVENSVTQAASFMDSLDILYTSPQHGTVSHSGPADAVLITFDSGSGVNSFSGFTFRVVIYAMDEADVCGTASSPKTISLTTDYPVACLAAPNFPANYPEGAVCYTKIDSPDGYNVMVNYIATDIVNLADYFFIYDVINPSSPILLRAETAGFLSASQLGSRSFDTRTTALHTVFSDSGTTENPGILVFSAVPV
ncbi:uncharacterized protein [Apostichopus japonicus]|uniref:uncharacterized protein n=1 Tax=Stichopus japonicus TaxID=307972 RepID=UPI003AB1F53A